ncbi:hypothetical protein NEIFL0001_1227 [Neisseria flavescens SK114]|nr:hypothetical protein NEIFL0001_1227 [Neisseria flavescens SK114]
MENNKLNISIFILFDYVIIKIFCLKIYFTLYIKVKGRLKIWV